MRSITDDPKFSSAYGELRRVKLNPGRHTASNALEHSELVSRHAVQLAHLNRCLAWEVSLLENLGRAHDIGKITGTARPERSLEVLAGCEALPEEFLALVKWHDIALPWWRSAERGQPSSDKAWRRLAEQVDVRLLAIFMVADRVDAPPGWRGNPPTTWFLSEARRRGLIGNLVLDAPDQPSEVAAGAALVRPSPEGATVLAVSARDGRADLPAANIEWDELPGAAAIRALSDVISPDAALAAPVELGHIDSAASAPAPETGTYTRRVRYFLVVAAGLDVGNAAPGRPEHHWITATRAQSIQLCDERMRSVLRSAFRETGGEP